MRALLPLLLLGCAEPSDGPVIVDEPDPEIPGCEVGDVPTLQIGKGEIEWSDNDADEGRSILIHGVQGGYHSFVSIRAEHLSTEAPWDMEIVGRLDDEILAEAVLTREATCVPEVQQLEAVGTWLIWRSQPEILHEQVVTIDVVVSDIDGRTVSATAEQVIWDQEAW